MHLADPVYLDDGRLLAAAGTALSAEGIRVLQGQGFVNLTVHERHTDDIEVPELIPGDLRRDVFVRLKQLYGFLRRKLAAFEDKPPTQVLAALRGTDVQREFAKVNVYQSLESLAESLLVELVSSQNLDGLSALRRVDVEQIDHSTNVAIACGALAFQIAMTGQRRNELVLGALLHDVGMVFVSPQTAAKEESLTVAEMSRILAHTRLGYALLQIASSTVWFMSNHVALQHHERQDGQGYPRGLYGTNHIERSEHELFDPERIVMIAEIAAIAETYEALSADRPYRRALPSEEVRTVMRSMGGNHLNAELIEVFLRMVPAYHTGSVVQVESGEHTGCRGVVMFTDKDHMVLPRVRVLWSPSGESISPVEIDFATADLGSGAVGTLTAGDAVFRLEGLTRQMLASVGAAVDPKHASGQENYTDEEMPAIPAELLVPEADPASIAEAEATAAERAGDADAQHLEKLANERVVLERLVPQQHPLRQLRAALSGEVISMLLEQHQSADWPLERADHHRMFRLYVLQTIFGYESERDLMMDVHVNMAFRWFCGFSVSDELHESRALAEFRNAIGQRLFISISSALLALADSTIDAVRMRRRTRSRAR